MCEREMDMKGYSGSCSGRKKYNSLGLLGKDSLVGSPFTGLSKLVTSFPRSPQHRQ